jgi:hypothetical protein
MKFDGMKPAPPVTRTRLGIACDAGLRTHGLCPGVRLNRPVEPREPVNKHLNHGAQQVTCFDRRGAD